MVNEEYTVFHAPLDHGKGLDPFRARCVLAIDVAMLTKDTGGHSVLLRSPVTEAADSSVNLRVWTWAELRAVNVPKPKFEQTYFGAVIGFI